MPRRRCFLVLATPCPPHQCICTQPTLVVMHHLSFLKASRPRHDEPFYITSYLHQQNVVRQTPQKPRSSEFPLSFSLIVIILSLLGSFSHSLPSSQVCCLTIIHRSTKGAIGHL
ncbi:hypothetical protein BDN70DRAFT_886106 [Pholiota conissans]|uniref:Uncharacterized protein n=1 Tax=Pholiota conissans TaxID=109636 RepID=A0A9P5YR13_9AGAR|nr:hypothetical protein BDN70DRAFT_886106 [Pholiota conissans]